MAIANRERWVGMTEWRVDAFSTLHQRGKKHYSDVFRVGDCPWRLSLYPRGNATVSPKNRDQVALYLEAADAGSAPEGWRRHVDFKLEICHEVRATPETPARDRRDGRRHPTQSLAFPARRRAPEISRARAPARRSDRSDRPRGFPSNPPRPSTPPRGFPEDPDPPR